ncbi:MAG: outer membrane beta-barrel protein [candidate division Zixibacteria bacterium]|nr:outer membrane beta-barrel protein [candidate division Zixibacteria bacterium]
MHKNLMHTGLVGLVVMLVLISGSLCAQERTTFYGGAGIGMPSSPSEFSDYWKMGFHGSVGIGFPLSPNVRLVPKLEYHSFAFDWGKLGVVGIDGLDMQALLIGADVRVALGVPTASARPYLLGELGMGTISFSDVTGAGETIPVGLDETKMYIGLGGGLEFASSPSTKFFFQFRYISITTSGEATTFIPITAGVAIGFGG